MPPFLYTDCTNATNIARERRHKWWRVKEGNLLLFGAGQLTIIALNSTFNFLADSLSLGGVPLG